MRDLLALADTLREATRRHGARLIVNDRADVALAAGRRRRPAHARLAAGVGAARDHAARLPDRAPPCTRRRRRARPRRRAPTSSSSARSTTPRPSGATARRRAWPRSRRSPARWTARSSRWAGITPERVPEVLAAGAAGVAVIGAIYAAGAARGRHEGVPRRARAARDGRALGRGDRRRHHRLRHRRGPGQARLPRHALRARAARAPRPRARRRACSLRSGQCPNPGPFTDSPSRAGGSTRRVAAELRELTGVDVEHMTAGTLYPLHSGREIAEARASTDLAAGQRSSASRWWRASDLRALEPALAKDVSAAPLRPRRSLGEQPAAGHRLRGRRGGPRASPCAPAPR